MTSESKIVRAFTYQWKTKLYLFLMACLLWIFVANSQVYEIVLPIPIEPVNIKEGKIIVSEMPADVKVRFSGSGKDLLVLKYIQHPKLQLDLQTINYFYDYPLRESFIEMPPGVAVVAEEIVEPDTVKVILEDQQVIRVPIEHHITVTPQAGYTVTGQFALLPDSVNVAGPKSLIRNIYMVQTEKKIFEKIKKDFSETVGIIVEHPDKVIITPSSTQFQVKIDKIAERRINWVPVGAIRIPQGRRVILEPSTISVVLRGASTRLAGLSADSIDAYVNLSKWDPGTKDYIPEFNLPQGLEFVESVPEQVRVRVEVR